MLYRNLGRTGERVSILGFGAMRLPILDGRPEQIDVPLATRMLHYAIQAGVNYVDTAYIYHTGPEGGQGMSEPFLGGALTGGLREKVLLATKLPPWHVNTREDMDAVLERQLQALNTEYIDGYLVHGLNSREWARLVELGVRGFLDAARADGRIRFAGFSFHDEGSAFKPIVDGYDWDLCQIQYNYMDTDIQAGEAGLRYAAGRGLGVVVMEPLKGGRLAARVPDEVRAVFGSDADGPSPADWALRFVWNRPEVSLLLSGMGTMEQVVANVEAAKEGLADSLSADDLAKIESARRVYRERLLVDCTACRYCLPCPSGVDIPTVFSHLNATSLYGHLEAERSDYARYLKGKASLCTECGECEEKCPQLLSVREHLTSAVRILES
jgi:uncharacterized protein